MLKKLREWYDERFADPQVGILVLLLFAGFALVFLFGKVLMPVLISIVLAYLLDGMALALQRFKVPRLAAILIVFLLFMTGLLVLLIWLLPLLSAQIGQMIQQLPTIVASGQKGLMQLPERYPDFISKAQIDHIVNTLGTELTRFGQRLLSISFASVRGLISFIVFLILIPFMVFFFLKDKVLILNWFSALLPKDRGLATEVWGEVNIQIGNYARGKLWEILIVWSCTYMVFVLLGLEFALLLSLFVGLSVLIPYIGATVMTFPVALVAYAQWGLTADFFYAVIAYGVIQALDGNLLVPFLFSEVVNLHPVAIILAVLFFGGLWGLWGLFFAIPLATLIHSVMDAWRRTYKEAVAAKEKEEATTLS
jgi:putative permease